jgi:group I intron endonuclease
MEINKTNLDFAGVYKLTCSENGKIYIGKSINIYKRLIHHKSNGKKSRSRCFFENAIVKYGWESFQVEVLEVFEGFDKLKDNDDLIKRETYYIKLYNSTDRSIGYNLCEEHTDRTGSKCSNETKEKIRQAKLGTKMSKESQAKRILSVTGRRNTPETIEKMRKSAQARSELTSRQHRGKKLSEETKKKLSIAHLGKNKSLKARENMSKAKLGKPTGPFTDERKRNISKSLLGKKRKAHTEEHKQKIRETKARRKLEREEIKENV